MTDARKKIADLLWWVVPSQDTADAKAKAGQMLDAYRDEVALDLGRDLLRDGLDAFLRRLIGPANAARIAAESRAAGLRGAADVLTMDWGGPDHEAGMDEARKQLRQLAEPSHPGEAHD
ncbi:hypothetical protein ACIP79_00600 [Streptomyces sp. NPDC088747]|uniref:hypothetical protein n=1 Tax=Streptomyces sp. NPDC088747 TaxID=3365886 RepID=UPI0037F72712